MWDAKLFLCGPLEINNYYVPAGEFLSLRREMYSVVNLNK